jgi:hypothetical protein
MRERVTEPRLQAFMRILAHGVAEEGRLYLTGGACAVLLGWRVSTLDVDIKVFPEQNAVLRAIASIKETLNMNIELASPDDFIPPLPGWQDRSRFIVREGKLSFHHYDFYAQALAKIERGHDMDRDDVRQMFEAKLVEPARLRELFEAIEPELYRYPAIGPQRFRRAVESALQLQ